MGRQLTISLFYLVLITPLCLHIKLPATPDYRSLNSALYKDATRQLADVRLTLEEIHRIIKTYHLEHYGSEFYQKGLALNNNCLQLFGGLQQYKNELEHAFKRQHSHDRNGVKLTRKYFIAEHRQDSINVALNALLSSMLSAVDTSDTAFLKKELLLQYDMFRIPDMFRSLSLEAALAVLSAMQNNIAASDMVMAERFYDYSMPKTDCSGPTAIAIPLNAYVLPGRQVNALVFLADYNKSIDPVLSSNEGQITVSEGIGHWRGRTSGTGIHKVKGLGTIRLRDTVITKPWSFEFFVTKNTFANLSFDKMNICYRGIPCPVTIAADGYPPENILLDVPHAIVKATTPGHFEIIAPEAGPRILNVRINLKDRNGKTTPVGGMVLTVKDAPLPALSFGNGEAGIVTMEELQKATGLRVEPPDEDIRYEIDSWSLTFIQKGKADEMQTVMLKGAGFSNEVRQMLRDAGPGDRLVASEVVIQDNYGHTYSLPPLSVRIKQ